MPFHLVGVTPAPGAQLSHPRPRDPPLPCSPPPLHPADSSSGLFRFFDICCSLPAGSVYVRDAASASGVDNTCNSLLRGATGGTRGALGPVHSAVFSARRAARSLCVKLPSRVEPVRRTSGGGWREPRASSLEQTVSDTNSRRSLSRCAPATRFISPGERESFAAHGRFVKSRAPRRGSRHGGKLRAFQQVVDARRRRSMRLSSAAV